MATNNTLGIIVNSNRFFEEVTHLVDAALEDQKKIRMHLLGPGWAYIHTRAYQRLRKAVYISLCAISAYQYAAEYIDLKDNSISVVDPRELSKLLKDCYRYVVF